MNIYSKKQRWKLILATIAAVIVLVSLWYTSILVGKISEEEKNKAKSWAEAIQRKAELVSYTQELFQKISEEERKKVGIWAEAIRRIITSSENDLTFYSDIINSNTTIPIIRTDESGQITGFNNLDSTISDNDTVFLREQLSIMKEVNEPIEINYVEDQRNYLYYNQSSIFTELRKVLVEQIESFNSDIITNSASAPVIYVDSNNNVLAFGNIDSSKVKSDQFIEDFIAEIQLINQPIEINLGEDGTSYIYYDDSPLLVKLKYYPFIQLSVIGLFLIFAYYLFSTARKSEQNQVWVGMAKETAHQLGTPLSSLLAWIEVLKSKNVDEKTITEIKRDLSRLETVTERFSKIGSKPNLEQKDVNALIENTLAYLKTRLSKKVNFNHIRTNENQISASVNVPLLEWVLENIIKNGVDAIGGEGNIEIKVSDQSQFVYIDITDDGKGVPKGARKTIFQPGYTTKKRGWGLGLSLTKRIVENYHSGKVFVKNSEAGKGTTFRIVLNKVMQNGRNIHSYSFL